MWFEKTVFIKQIGTGDVCCQIIEINQPAGMRTLANHPTLGWSETDFQSFINDLSLDLTFLKWITYKTEPLSFLYAWKSYEMIWISIQFLRNSLRTVRFLGSDPPQLKDEFQNSNTDLECSTEGFFLL